MLKSLLEALIINKMLLQNYDQDIKRILSERANHNKFIEDLILEHVALKLGQFFKFQSISIHAIRSDRR